MIEMNTFIQQGCITSDSKNYQKSKKILIKESLIYHSFLKNIKQHNCFQHW